MFTVWMCVLYGCAECTRECCAVCVRACVLYMHASIGGLKLGEVCGWRVIWFPRRWMVRAFLSNCPLLYFPATHKGFGNACSYGSSSGVCTGMHVCLQLCGIVRPCRAVVHRRLHIQAHTLLTFQHSQILCHIHNNDHRGMCQG